MKVIYTDSEWFIYQINKDNTLALIGKTQEMMSKGFYHQIVPFGGHIFYKKPYELKMEIILSFNYY